jgi:thiol-disulfide isomerase/thioredoxin
LLWLLVGGVAVIAIAVIALTAMGKDDAKVAKDAAGRTIAQTRRVTVSGEALPTPVKGETFDPAVGMVAPTLKGSNFAGTPVTIGPDGHPQAIAFVAHWCPHCQREIPKLSEWLKTQGLPGDVELYIVPTGTLSNAPNYPPSTWLDDAGLASVPTLVDNDASDAHAAFGGGDFPNWVYLDKDHKVVLRTSGEYPDGEYDAIFGALAKGEKPVDIRAQ